jgi:CubicO group peptidase (beta-lactamase class C family)
VPRTPEINGTVSPGFEPVRDQFARNFAERGELGSACAAFAGGEKVVDLWGGIRDDATGETWEEDTLTIIFSTSKGIAGAALAMAHSRGWFELEQPVAKYWPEFAQAGKERITVRELLSHRAGLSAIDARLTPAIIADLDTLARVLEKQAPAWKPGERHGYHGISLGFYQNELLRRVDPMRRTIGRFVREEINPRLEGEMYIGVPRDLPEKRVAWLRDFHPLRTILHPRSLPPLAILAMAWPRSPIHRSLMNPRLRRPRDLTLPPLRHLELPAANGFATARGLAALFGDLATRGPKLGLSEETFRELVERQPPPTAGPRDAVMLMDLAYSAFGFFKPAPAIRFGSSRRAFGSPGVGGSFAFADPETGLGYAYTSNRMGFYLFTDPREKSLRDAVMACLRRRA